MTHKAKTFFELQKEAIETLSAKGIDTAKLDARILMETSSGLTHAGLISAGAENVPELVLKKFKAFLDRRLNGEPVDRIIGSRQFFGRNFKLKRDTLAPRDDTEALIERVLEVYGDPKRPAHLLEIGTGSGIIAITLARELPNARVTATDISQAALRVARENAETNGVIDRIEFLHTNLFDGVADQYDFIVSNPPYIVSDDIKKLSREVRDHDPRIALDGGEDGLDFYREIFGAGRQILRSKGQLIVEIGADQAKSVIAIGRENGFTDFAVKQDLAGLDRVVSTTL